jgi:hypothetical protein
MNKRQREINKEQVEKSRSLKIASSAKSQNSLASYFFGSNLNKSMEASLNDEEIIFH